MMNHVYLSKSSQVSNTRQCKNTPAEEGYSDEFESYEDDFEDYDEVKIDSPPLKLQNILNSMLFYCNSRCRAYAVN
jgi:hypothetical protein